MKSDRNLEVLALTSFFLVAVTLRFWALDRRGFVFWDEGKFGLEGQRVAVALTSLFGDHVSPTTGKAIGTAKPSHALLLAVGYLIFGARDVTALGVSAVCSLISLALTIHLARRIGGSTVALIAAAALATSPYDVIYARSALSESDATVFLLAAVLLSSPWLSVGSRSVPWARTVLAGMALGIGFTVNYRLLVYGFALVGFGSVVTWRDHGLLQTLRRAMAWLCGGLIPIVAWDVAGFLARSRGITLFRNELTLHRSTYLQEVAYQLHGGKQAATAFRPLPYLQWFGVREGGVVCVLVAIAVALAFLRPNRTLCLVTIMIVVPYVSYVFAPFCVPRNLASTLPFVAISVGIASRELITAIRRSTVRVTAGFALTAAVALPGLTAAWALTGVESGFAFAAAYVTNHDGGGALTSNEILVYYLRGNRATCRAPAMPFSARELAADRAAGYRVAVLDRHSTHPLAETVARDAPRLARFTELGAYAGEDLISSENGYAPGSGGPKRFVTVLDLTSLHLPRTRQSPAPCNRDHVT